MSGFRMFVLFLFLTGNISSQTHFFVNADSVLNKRLIPVSIGVGAAWSGSMIGLSSIWYQDVEKTKWHTFDDSKNWLQMDKIGHSYTAYQLNRYTSNLFRWSGVKHKKAVFIGAGVSFGYQTTLEMFDAYTQEWGFSWADMASNVAGNGFYVAQELIWKDQRLLPKFSYHPTEFAAVRPEVLGGNFAESLLKDYNGQTYWLSVNISSFLKQPKFPKWICVSLGYSAHEKLVGDADFYIDGNDRPYEAQREWLLSLDIDFSKFDIKRPWLKTLVNQFNYLKVPFPTLIYRNQSLIVHPFYF